MSCFLFFAPFSTKSNEQQFCRQNRVVKERSEEKGQTGQSRQEGDSNANNHTLQQWCAEEHLRTHNASNLFSG